MAKISISFFRCAGVIIFDKKPKGWKRIKGATTAPNGYVWINNGLSIFDKGYQHALLKTGK